LLKKLLKFSLIVVLPALLVLGSLLFVFGQRHPAGIAGNTLEEKLENYTDLYAKQNGFSGTVLVAEKDRILFHKSYGFASAEDRIMNRNDTQYRIASITKIITAAAIAKLEEEGKLSLDDPLTRYFPDHTQWEDIQVKHLLAHSSGLTSFEFVALDDVKSNDSNVTNEDITQALLTQAAPEEQLETISEKPLSFLPGERSDYKNANYMLLGLIIEKITGQSYAEYVHDHLFIPAQMKDTVFHEEEAPRLADPYSEGQRTTDTTSDTLYSFGGAISTASDVFQFIRALQTGQLVSHHQVEKMGKPLFFNRGYGWITSELFKQPTLSHGGDTLGFSSHLIYFPDSEYSVIVLSNHQLNLSNAYGGTSQVLKYLYDSTLKGGAHNLAAELASLLTGKTIWAWEKIPGSF